MFSTVLLELVPLTSVIDIIYNREFVVVNILGVFLCVNIIKKFLIILQY